MFNNVPAVIIATFVALGNAGVTAVIVQTLKVLFVDPRWPAGPQRDAILRILNYIINLVLLMIVVFSAGVFSPADIPFYLLLAGGQGILAHVGFTSLKSDGRAPASPGS